MAGLKLVLDYSGTLSLEATAFAKDGVLERQLLVSGLAGFGVASPEAFWSNVVNPTWEEGSRTAIGYGRLITEKISGEWNAERKDASLAALAKAARSFVAAYFSHSRIDPAWRPLLRELSGRPLVTTVVATDHYAEATEAIKGHLADMGINAVSLPGGDAVPGGGFYIANSADLGFHKDEEEFWLRVRDFIPGVPGDRLLLVDDFGANETAGDDYGQEARVAGRRQRTAELLAQVFAGPVEVMPFVLSGEEAVRGAEAGRLIGRIAVRIGECLRERGGPHV